MSGALKVSVCSRGASVDYYWRLCVTANHLAECVAKLMDCTRSPDRKSTPYLDSDNQAQFEKTLGLAKKGKLRPGDHVKTVTRDPLVDLFEMRWDDVAVIPMDPVSGLYGKGTAMSVRLYYIETGEAWVVGLHAHEKKIGGSEQETRDLQDTEIDCALRLHRSLEAARWGVPELSADLDTPDAGLDTEV